MFKRKKDKISKSKIDENLLRYIQARGGITFKNPSYVETGTGYIKPIHILKLPELLQDKWLDRIINIEDTIAVVDISTKDKNEAKKNINNSIKEELSISATSKDYMQIYDANKRKEELELLYNEISLYGEVIKQCDFRIFLSNRVLNDLEEMASNMLISLEADNYEASVLLNEMRREYDALTSSYTVQRNNIFHIDAVPLTSESIAIGEPFIYSELIDDTGDFLGITKTGGSVIFDEFTKTSKRRHYSSIIIGDLGSGKSTHLKKRFKANACKGNFIRTFDVSGEFYNITKEFGGKVIKCSMDSARINPLEIHKFSDDEHTNYARHISKLGIFFNCLSPNLTDDEKLEIENSLRDLYEKYELIPGKRKLVGLAKEEYPIFSDFLEHIEEKLDNLKKKVAKTTGEEKEIEVEVQKTMKVKAIVSNIVKNYANLFDGYTNIENLVDEKIVTFDLSEIKDMGNIYTAQLFNMLSLCWDNSVTNGLTMKDLFDKYNIGDLETLKSLFIMDEAHRLINTRMPFIAEQILKYVKEARKYFIGFTFALHSIRDAVPESGDSDAVDIIKNLFERMQYKFIFQQDPLACKLIEKVFNGQLTYSQIEEIPTFGAGDCVLSISGDKSIRFKESFNPRLEGALFAGGK